MLNLKNMVFLLLCHVLQYLPFILLRKMRFVDLRVKFEFSIADLIIGLYS